MCAYFIDVGSATHISFSLIPGLRPDVCGYLEEEVLANAVSLADLFGHFTSSKKHTACVGSRPKYIDNLKLSFVLVSPEIGVYFHWSL